MSTLPAFTNEQFELAKRLLATQVGTMMGRKLEEGDWSSVYCRAKQIPDGGWSNLHIDVNYNGLGLELKLLRVPQLNGRPLKSVCGTTLMHPAATRSIRIDDSSKPADRVKENVLGQYAALIEQRKEKVQAESLGVQPDMRTGWLIWEDSLSEFLYFEERMRPPDPSAFFAEWNLTPARGVRKPSKSLWVYDKVSKQKRYSVTTAAGAKIQPYFDVPPPSDPNLYYFRVQGEQVDDQTIRVWVTPATASALRRFLGTLDRETLSAAITRVLSSDLPQVNPPSGADLMAEPLLVTKEVYERVCVAWDAVSDEHRAQILLRALEATPND